VKKNPTSVDSNAWKSLMKIKKKVEPHILGKIQANNSNFWWDNWTGKGALANLVQGPNKSTRTLVSHFFTNDS